MDVKQAIGKAREYLAFVFADEDVSEVRLEEVVYDRNDGAWLVTFGLMRPTTSRREAASVFSPPFLKRTYKVVRVPRDESEPPSIRIRELTEEA